MCSDAGIGAWATGPMYDLNESNECMMYLSKLFLFLGSKSQPVHLFLSKRSGKALNSEISSMFGGSPRRQVLTESAPWLRSSSPGVQNTVWCLRIPRIPTGIFSNDSP